MIATLKVGVPPYICPANNYTNCTFPDFLYISLLADISKIELNPVPVNGSADAHKLISSGVLDTSAEVFARTAEAPDSWIPSFPVGTSSFCILYRKKALLDTPLWFLLPLQWSVWVAVLATIVASGWVMYIFEPSREVIGSWILAMASIVGQAKEEKSTKLSTRLFAVGWLLTAFLLSTYYTSVLMTFLVDSSDTKGPSDIHSAIAAVESGKYDKMQFVIKDYMLLHAANEDNVTKDQLSRKRAVERLTSASRNTVQNTLTRFAARHPEKVEIIEVRDFEIPSMEYVLQLLITTQEHVIMYVRDSPVFDATVNCNRSLAKVVVKDTEVAHALHLHKNTSATVMTELNLAILKGLEIDMRQKLINQDFVKKYGRPCLKTSTSNAALSETQVFGPLMLAAGGCALALVALLTERFWHRNAATRNKPQQPLTSSYERHTKFKHNHHWPLTSQKLAQCQFCLLNCTKCFCSSCGCHLCYDENRNCFYDYHFQWTEPS